MHFFRDPFGYIYNMLLYNTTCRRERTLLSNKSRRPEGSNVGLIALLKMLKNGHIIINIVHVSAHDGTVRKYNVSTRRAVTSRCCLARSCGIDIRYTCEIVTIIFSVRVVVQMTKITDCTPASFGRRRRVDDLLYFAYTRTYSNFKRNACF